MGFALRVTVRARQVIARRFGGPDVLEVAEVDLAGPGRGEVLIEVRAAGVNPADGKALRGGHGAGLPFRPGFEVAGILAAIGPDTVLASGGGTVGDRVVAFRVRGGYASAIVVPARDVFAAPAALDDPAAANLLLAGTTAADLLEVTRVVAGETVLLHGASGAVGVSVLQQAALLGIRVIGTAGPDRFEEVRRFGGEPVAYGPGLEHRVRQLAAGGVSAAFDCAGTSEAAEVSLRLVADRSRIATVVDPARAARDGFLARGGENSRVHRDAARGPLIELAEEGRLIVPVARTFPLDRAGDALELLATGHPGGKLALVP